MINIALLVLGYIFIAEYVPSNGIAISLIKNLLLVGILLNIRYEYENVYGKDNYLFKKEMKYPYFVLFASASLYGIYKVLSNIQNLKSNLASTQDFIALGIESVFFVVFTALFIYVIFKDVLNLSLTRPTYSFSTHTTESSEEEREEKEESRDVEIIREEKMEEKKSEIRKVPVIVITQE